MPSKEVEAVLDRVEEYKKQIEDIENQLNPFETKVEFKEVEDSYEQLHDAGKKLTSLVELANQAARKGQEPQVNDNQNNDNNDDDDDEIIDEMNTPKDKLVGNFDDDIYSDPKNDPEVHDHETPQGGDDPFGVPQHLKNDNNSDDDEVNIYAAPSDVDDDDDNGGLDLSEFRDPIYDKIVEFIQSKNLAPVDFGGQINDATEELIKDLRDQGNNDAEQMRQALAGILNDVPKVVNSYLPNQQEMQNDNNDDIDDESVINENVNDDDQVEASSIPQSLIDKIQEAMDRRFGDVPEKAEYMQKVIKSCQGFYKDDFDRWDQMYEAEVFQAHKNYLKYKKDNPDLPDTGFELRAKYWKDNKGTFVDTKKTLYSRLENYEKLLAKAEAAKDFDKLVQFEYCIRYLEHVAAAARVVKKGLNKKQKESSALLSGVPKAVQDEENRLAGKLVQAGQPFAKLKYTSLDSNPAFGPLWGAFLRDKNNKAHAQQENVKKRIEVNDRSEGLKKIVIDSLNMHRDIYVKLEEDINDADAWAAVKDKVIFQLQQAFPLPFYQFVKQHAKARAAQLKI